MPPQGIQYIPPQAQQAAPATFQHPMMMFFGNNPGALWLFGILWIITWVLFMAVLVALLRWLWKKGDKV
jgi:ABC-type uncharacterized transport system permease subunit